MVRCDDVYEGSLNGIVEMFESDFFNGRISCGFMLEIMILRSSSSSDENEACSSVCSCRRKKDR